MMIRELKFETKQLHVGQEQPDPVTDSRAVPIYQITSYVFHSSQHAADRFGLRAPGHIYARLTNPTQSVFEKRLAALEGGVGALGVASSAAAVTSALQNLNQLGDHIVSAITIYGGTYNLLAHITLGRNHLVNPDETDCFKNAIRETTKLIFIESIGNPNASLINIWEIAATYINNIFPREGRQFYF